jgi:gliding motility-associatede transport system auxiliary component
MPRHALAQDLLLHLLLVMAATLAAWLSVRHVTSWDWTSSHRNSLAPESLALLRRLQGPLRLTSYIPDNAPLRRRIRDLLERFQRARPDRLEVRILDPELHPDLARKAGVELAGELVLEYGGRRLHLHTLSEGHIDGALRRLLGHPPYWIAGLIGHGERSLTGKANQDLGRFGAALEQRGYRLETLDLARTPVIPDNLGLLVLASPQTDLLPGEVERLYRWVSDGGDLLWLMEPDGLHGLAPLLERLGVRPLPGRIVDANVAALGITDPTVALVNSYPDRPATAGFRLLTLFPGALALETVPAAQWRAQELLATQSRSWNETGPIQGRVQRDPDLGEQAGPLALGIALQRPRPRGTTQRVLVVGDGDFLSNTFLDNAGNRDLGLRLVDWLMAEEDLLGLPSRPAGDRDLIITPRLSLVLGGTSLLLLPISFLITGLLIQRARQRG